MTEIYEIEYIYGKSLKRSKNKTFYGIKWLGYSSEQNTFEPETSISAEEVIILFEMILTA